MGQQRGPHERQSNEVDEGDEANQTDLKVHVEVSVEAGGLVSLGDKFKPAVWCDIRGSVPGPAPALERMQANQPSHFLPQCVANLELAAGVEQLDDARAGYPGGDAGDAGCAEEAELQHPAAFDGGAFRASNPQASFAARRLTLEPDAYRFVRALHLGGLLWGRDDVARWPRLSAVGG